MKIGISLFGALGVVGLFMSDIGLDFTTHMVDTIILLAAFAIPIFLGLIGLAKPPFQMWQSGMALACFALVVVKYRIWQIIAGFLKLQIGDKLVVVAAIAGVIVSIIALAKPEDKG